MATLKSHPSRWRRRPTWPTLRFADGQTETLIVVGEPWTFELPPVGGNRTPPTKHLVNVVKRSEITNSHVRRCYVWEISDRVFQSINFDPTEIWFQVTRHGGSKSNTRYEIKPLEESNEYDRRCIDFRLTTDLELVAIETRARLERHHRSRK